jgi:hypothetical protein
MRTLALDCAVGLARALFLLALFPLGVACRDQGAGAVYVNETVEPLQFSFQKEGDELVQDELVPPRSEATQQWVVRGRSVRIIAERPDGRRVFDCTYTWAELGDDLRRPPRIVVSSLTPLDEHTQWPVESSH